MKAKQTPIAAAVSIALLSAAVAARAQDAPQAAAAAPAAAASSAEPNQLDTVVVTGMRAAQLNALNVKRNAEAHIDVISAEDIGKMPDKNVADSLARVPGVAVLNSPAGGSGGFDERDRVGLRGTNPSLTQTLLDGHSVANGDWFVLDQTGAGVGRSVSFSLLPSELVSRVEVHKTAEASDTEGGTAGSVNIITRKPLDFTKALTFEGSVGAVYANLPDKTDPQLGALVNWRNDQKTFGLMLQAFDEKRHLRRDGVETIALDSQPHAYQAIGAAESAITAQAPSLAGALYPNLLGSALFTQQRERKGGVLTAELRPAQDFDVSLTGFSSKMDADNYNRNFMLANPWALQSSNVTLKDYTVDPSTNVITSADYTFATPTKIGVYDMISRKASASTNFVSLESSYKVNDALKFKGNVGTSKGVGRTDSQDVYEGDMFGTAGGWSLNGSGSAPSFYLTPAATPGGNAGVPYQLDWIFGDQNVVVVDKESWGQVDGEYTLDSGMLRSLKFGLRESDHKRYTDGPIIGQGPNWGAPVMGANGLPIGLTQSQYTGSYPSNYGQGLGSGFPTNIMFPSEATLAAYDAINAVRPLSRREPTHEYSVQERTSAAFLQGNLEGENWSGNVGLRVVNTKESVLVWVPTSDTSLPGYAASAFAAVGPKWTDPSGYYQTYHDRSYNDLLPSASIRIDVTRDIVARFALSRTMTRPDYTALSSAQLLGGYSDPTGKTVGTGTTGNPDLNPVRSTNFDANFEWYFAPRAFVSFGAFHMEMGSYIIDGVKRETLTTDLIPSGGQQGAVGNQLITAPFDLQTQINMKAAVTGLEFAFERPIYNNFGVSANYTYADGHDATGHVLRGSVKHTANLGGFYEDDHFSARVNYGYTSDNYLGIDRGTDYYQRGVGVLSASLGYKYNDHLSLTFDAQNLNDPILKYYGNVVSEPRAIYNNGRQFYLTARFKY